MTTASAATFCTLCDALLADVGAATASGLDAIAKDLALNETLRLQLGTSDPSIWPSFHQTWDALARRVSSDENDESTRCLVTSLARFTRNLVASVPSNQLNAYVSEPSLRHILHAYSSWTVTQDPKSYVVTRMLIQTLSNIVTTNDDLMIRLWETHLNLPEDQVVFIRLLGSPDTRTILSLLVLFVNCIHESDARREMLVKTRVGVRLCITLLDRMVNLHDAEISSDGGEAFDYMYHLFAHLFDGGFAPKLYANLKVSDEVIVPHQTTLLKLLDSYLHSSHSSAALIDMCPMLTASFFELCAFSIQAVANTVGVDNAPGTEGKSSGHGAFDILLPKACEALVLVTQCLVSALLEFEENRFETHSNDELLLLIRGAVSPHGQDIAACTTELLRLLDVFLPRINFGKPISPSQANQSIPGTTDPMGFSYVKRDLVRLLAVLCHKNKRIQDSVRKCGGIAVIMNMCVVDERNPYLREHAILALHNLLEDNEENQGVVNAIQPSERWDQNGVLER